MTDSPPAALTGIAVEIDAYLSARIAQFNLPENLREAVRYAVLGGGKRLRPVLTLLTCEAVGGRRKDALGPAAAMELIHTFSLVHDDLPAMDDDDLRRGRPTLHVHNGEAMAILAGDVMVSLAFELAGEGPLSADQSTRIISELAHATTRMIAGQVFDTLGGFRPGATARQKLDEIHQSKTGALLRASCRMGAICGGADDQQLTALSAYGESIGLMFQIVDDVLDVTGSPEHTGKATGKDQTAGKITFPGVIGMEESLAEIRRLQQAAHDCLRPLGERARLLAELCDYLAIRTR